jgi:phospholipid/cholesterol/gamma-HCH transport system substrate-binding protein
VFANLNSSFPFLRAFAREALPGVRSSGPTLEVATPFIYQLRKLVSKPELRGLVHDLRPTVPKLAKLTRSQLPFMEQARALSSCFNHTIIPWSNMSVTAHDGEGAAGTVAEETGYGLAGIAGESRSGDANGQYIRVAAGGGTNTLFSLLPINTIKQTIGGEQQVGVLDNPILGADPPFDSSARPPFKPAVPCETQAPPNLDSGGATGPPPGQARLSSSSGPQNGQLADVTRRYASIYMDYMRAQQMEAQGNALGAKRLMGQVEQESANYQRQDMPLYEKAIKSLSGSGG